MSYGQGFKTEAGLMEWKEIKATGELPWWVIVNCQPS